MTQSILEWVTAQVQAEMPEAGMATQMRAINDRYLSQGHGSRPPFPAHDIVQAEFTDHLRQHCTARERALVIIQEMLQRVWVTWHVSVAEFGETPSVSEISNLKLLHESLALLGLENLLLDDLPASTKQELLKALASPTEA